LEPGDELVDASVGPDGEVIAIWAAEAVSLHPRTVDPGAASFAEDVIDPPVRVRVARHAPGAELLSTITGLDLAFPTAQPMPNKRVLVVGSRVHWRPDAVIRNATMYDADGRVLAQGLVGDGVEHVQTTSSGQIWVAYFDEGVYGNNGWGESGTPHPIGAPGLIRFRPDVQPEWHFTGDHLAPIDDCYALNVAGEDAWVCYYSGFPIARVRDGAVRSWSNSVDGARALAVHGERVGLFGGYDESDRLVVGTLGEDALTVEREYRLTLPDGAPLVNVRGIGRGSTLHFIVGADWYTLDLATLS
jgi:hypothetical protein